MPLNKPFLHALKLQFPYQKQLDQILPAFEHDCEKAWEALRFKAKRRIDIKKEWDSLEAAGIKTIALGEDLYSQALANIKDPPSLLYYRGVLPPEGLNLAVVGSRKMSPYGISAADSILKPLAGQQVNIVSGLAYGIDAYAHQSALRLGLKTFAVLGAGVDRESIYPRESLNLSEGIIATGGGLISEFPPGTESKPAHFPLRNRIIAGLCSATIIIEAGIRSGARITGQQALDEGRDVFVVPGSIFEPLSEGCNALLKNNCARAITSGTDIIKEYGLDPVPAITVREPNLSEKELLLLSKIGRKAVTFEKILEKFPCGISELNSLLFQLEMKNLIRKFSDNTYALNLTRINNPG